VLLRTTAVMVGTEKTSEQRNMGYLAACINVTLALMQASEFGKTYFKRTGAYVGTLNFSK
jgi:hypothetical protein